MRRTAPVMTRVAPKTKAKLRDLAKSTNRSEAFLVSEAIENYVAVNEWQVGLIRERLAEAEAGGYTIPHEEVERRLGIEKRHRPKSKRAGSVAVKRAPKASAK